MIPKFIGRSKLPHKPGVYQFKNRKGRMLYVGKAIDLYSRVSSYFGSHPKGAGVRITALVAEIANVETIIVESELEALILEANLIKKYRPSFNVRLLDDKDYLYIGLTNEDFPKVVTLRRMDLGKMKKYFGPFPSSRTVKETLKVLRRVFPWCSGTQGLTLRACFYYHLGLCPGVCVGIITKEDYQKIISRFSRFLEGRKDQLLDELISEMNTAAQNQQFELAGKLKKTIEGIVYLTQPNKTKIYLENPNFLEDQRKIALEKLKEALYLSNTPERIEGYDISNIGGKEATGSMVVLTQGEIDKSQYRKFKIHISGKPDDAGMHKEMMERRIRHTEWPLPDLIIIDGGLGQVHAVEVIIRNSGYQIPIFGIAKRMEWLYSPGGAIIKLPKSHPGLQLLQRLRDEAHRFAIAYHRKLRDIIK